MFCMSLGHPRRTSMSGARGHRIRRQQQFQSFVRADSERVTEPNEFQDVHAPLGLLHLADPCVRNVQPFRQRTHGKALRLPVCLEPFEQSAVRIRMDRLLHGRKYIFAPASPQIRDRRERQHAQTESDLQKQLGHASIKTTEVYCTHVFDEDVRKALERLYD